MKPITFKDFPQHVIRKEIKKNYLGEQEVYYVRSQRGALWSLVKTAVEGVYCLVRLNGNYGTVYLNGACYFDKIETEDGIVFEKSNKVSQRN